MSRRLNPADNNGCELSTGEPLLCFVTTVYKAREALRLTLYHMARQSCMRFIHMILIDGDGEEYVDIVEDYLVACRSRPNNQVKVIYLREEVNRGCDMAHAYCFAHLPDECTHFCWLDAGDWLSPIFVQRFYGRYRKHPGFGWFHFNSQFYDKKTSKAVGKQSYQLYLKRYTKCPDQWAALGFGQFYYHVMVVDKKVFQAINPSYVFFGPELHFGSFYDAQIVAGLAVKRVKMLYDSKLTVHLLHDPNSVSSAYEPRPEKASFMAWYLRKIGLPSSEIELYEEYRKLSYPISQWNARLLTGEADSDDMFKERDDLCRFISQNHLPKWCFPRKRYYFALLFISKHSALRSLYCHLWRLVRQR